MVIKVRGATAGDVPEMQQVEMRAGTLFADIGMDSIASDPPPSAADFQPYFDLGTIWIAYQSREDGGDALIGWANASIVDSEGHLDQVSVDPSAQKRGVGSALVARVCEWAASTGLQSLTLTTFRDVEWNGPFYARRGFKELEVSDLGPELTQLRQVETERGLDVSPRVAMRLVLT